MKLSTFSDYSLRVLMYLGQECGRLATIAEVAQVHGISEAHLMKVVHRLGRAGYIETLRGKGGGMRLGKPAREIVLGEVIRETETDFELAECFASESTCRLRSSCRLYGVLNEALQGMFLVLDSYTLADLIVQPKTLSDCVVGG